MGYLIYVSLGLWETGGSIPPVKIGSMIEGSILCAASVIMTPYYE